MGGTAPQGRIVLVDDAVFMRRHLREMLERAHYEVVGEGEDGADLLALYETEHPDLVVLDIVMPKVTGIEALRELRAEHPEARVVVCSSLTDQRVLLEAVSLGARDYVLKPVQEARLLDAVAKAIRG